MLRTIVLVAVVLGVTHAQNCGNPTVQPTLSRFNSLIDILSGKSERIVGGIEATPHSWPWQVVVQVGGGLCGGSIIDDDWIMTAAHCCVSQSGAVQRPSSFRVTAGEHNRNRATEPNAKQYLISKVIPHPLYNNDPVEQQDFCLLKTSTPITFNDHVKPVCLGEEGDEIVGKTCYVTGWGRTVDSQWAPTSPVLQQAAVNIDDRAACHRTYNNLRFPSPNQDIRLFISEDMLCASSNNKDSCQGDSGGPLVCLNARGTYNLVGVVSWGVGCAVPGIPGVYGKTSTALEWIASTLSSN
ncbi:putative Ovochymase-1 [Hypsibius exemplaris]|uniref:Ovochymase-1 n=1 Tax=Hypsibius exemplaris TaxID=2072580 RepID=A0A1W0WRP0_HYPEX|nr:putative Ovochymase-1 [Hypsibius exemplaris]